MNRHLIILISLATSGLFLVGCASPKSRIKQHPELFNSFTPEVQAKVQAGEVEIGFTKDMAMIALGKADRTYARQTEVGNVEVWSYVNEEIRYEQQQARTTVYVNDVNGRRTQPVHQDVWVNAQNRREYEVLRVEFSDEGKIIAIEHLER